MICLGDACIASLLGRWTLREVPISPLTLEKKKKRKKTPPPPPEGEGGKGGVISRRGKGRIPATPLCIKGGGKSHIIYLGGKEKGTHGSHLILWEEKEV